MAEADGTATGRAAGCAILTRNDPAYSYEDTVEVGRYMILLWSVDRQVMVLDAGALGEDDDLIAFAPVSDWTPAGAAAAAVWLAMPYLTAEEIACMVTALAATID